MARGASQQENLLNTNAGKLLSNAQGVYGTTTSGYNSILQNPGYSAGDKAAITSSTLSPISSTYGSAAQDLYNRAARTRNSAGLTAGVDQLARSKAESLSNASGGLAKNFADTAMRERDAALKGIGSFYAPSLSAAGDLYGNATRAMAERPSVLQDIGGALGLAGQLGLAGVSAYKSLYPGK